MKHVQKSVLLWHSATQMAQLVADVTSYPAFLPWCARGEVLSTEGGITVARLRMVFGGITHAFTTRNESFADRRMTMTLVDGPFSMLDGVWQFTPLGEPSAAPGCRVEFDLRYAFASRALDAVVAPVFDRIAASLVDAFVARADAVHGPR